jgi:glycosyltransferase involved in cell wall biosynthesis
MLMSPVRRWARSFFVKQSALHCDHIIVVSDFSRRELIDAIPKVGNKTTVIWEAAVPRKSDSAGKALVTDSPYALAFSSLSLHKNIPRLIEAFRNARSRANLRQKLLLIGPVPTSVNLSDDIIVLPHQPETAVQALLSQADFLLVGSIYEGFGLPVLEAMAAGVPVACSSAGSLPEIAGSAALIFDPHSCTDIENSIIRMGTDESLRRELSLKGLENEERFSWDSAAEQTLGVYERVVSQYRDGVAAEPSITDQVRGRESLEHERY